MATLVLTAIGEDRPGLVDVLSGIVTAHGGSWERSQMARLGGKFAGIVQVELPDHRVAGLRQALGDLGEQGLLQVTVDGAGEAPALDGPRVWVTLMGSDHPGLVHAVSAVLASVGASIEELSTVLRDSPMAGGLTFEAHATVVLPSGVEPEDVREQLEALASHLMVDISVTE
ncbi:MAG: amino acid-binding ACT protein [Actinomycetales bacterium]|nr:amino acid-binding ACT protein [Actinomycetales bacterium]